MNADINYKQKACRDLIDLVTGEISQMEFINNYKVNSPKSIDYHNIISAATRGAPNVYDAKFAKSVGMTELELEPLRRLDAGYIAQKLIPALFKVAYTRTPNQALGGDGMPASYDRHYNTGIAAADALVTLTRIDANSPMMSYLYDEYFFPRIIPTERRTGLLSPQSVLNIIDQDYRLCKAASVKMLNEGMMK